jgi:penicillin-insensitive murein endopeptidase
LGFGVGEKDANASEWGEVPGPTRTPPQAIGGYAKGCLAGAVALPANGPGYQVIRLSRERYYGHPELIQFIEKLAHAARPQGWSGLLVGDMAQPRGGPMTSGHRSHQIGLDADIWFRAAPGKPLSAQARESVSAISMVNPDGQSVDRLRWSAVHARLLKTAASFPEVDRIFVNAAIKRELCAVAGPDRAWLSKIRPWWGHNYHFHVRLRCPANDRACENQDPLPPGDGCDESLAWWFSDAERARLDKPIVPPAKPPKPMALTELPPACRGVLNGS